MLLPGENPNKVGNIVQKQGPQFKELYYRLVTGLPGVHWENHCTSIVQDTSPSARLAHLRKLPSGLLKGVASPPHHPEEATEYWAKLSSRPDLASLVQGGKLAVFYSYVQIIPTPFQRNQTYCEIPLNSPDRQGYCQRRDRKEQSIRCGQDRQMVARRRNRKGSTTLTPRILIVATPTPHVIALRRIAHPSASFQYQRPITLFNTYL